MIADPEHLSDHPESLQHQPGDLLSEVLKHVRLAGEQVEALSLSSGDAMDRSELAGACLFFIAAGEVALTLGSKSYTVETGDLVLLPEGVGDGALQAGRTTTDLLFARFRFDARSLHGMVLVLPSLVHIASADGRPWLDGIAQFLRIEALDNQPGAALMVSRLIDLIVIRALRTWAQIGRTTGWLGGLADRRIAQALRALHDDPFRRWNLGELAESAGMSRSSFCERFTALVGRPPLRYHNELRLGMARAMIADQRMRIGEAGLKVGYESEAAFSRAYKAMFGRSPIRDREAVGPLSEHYQDA